MQIKATVSVHIIPLSSAKINQVTDKTMPARFCEVRILDLFWWGCELGQLL